MVTSGPPVPTAGAGGLVGYVSSNHDQSIFQQHVDFIASGGFIHELLFDGGHWTHNVLNSAPGGLVTCGPPVPTAEVLAGYVTHVFHSDDQQHIVFVSDRQVHELLFDSGHWCHSNLFTSAVPQVPTTGSGAVAADNLRLVGYISYNPDQQHVIFLSGGVVHELVFDGGHWSHFNLFTSAVPQVPTTGTDAVVADTLAGLAGYSSQSPDQQHVYYVTAGLGGAPGGHIHELLFDGGHWADTDLTQRTGAPAHPGCGIAGYFTPAAAAQHVNFISKDGNDNGHVNELFFGPLTWKAIPDLYVLVTPPPPPPPLPTVLADGFSCVDGYVSNSPHQQHVNFISNDPDPSDPSGKDNHVIEIFNAF